MIDIVNQAVPVLVIILLVLYWLRFRGGDPLLYNPAAAWCRAFIYFLACFLISNLTGTQAMILDTPIWTAAHLASADWWIWTFLLTAFILFAYWGIWMRYTIRFERKLHLASQVPFGLVWGLGDGATGTGFLEAGTGYRRGLAAMAGWPSGLARTGYLAVALA